MSTIFHRQAAAASEKDAVKEAEKEFEKAAAVRRAAFYADPSSPSREVCGKYTLFVCNTYARTAKLPADLTYSEPPRGVRPFTFSPPNPAQALGRAAGAHAALTESLDKIKGLPTPAI